MQVNPRLLPVALHGPLRNADIGAISANENPQKNFRSTIRARRGSVASSSSSASLRRVRSSASGRASAMSVSKSR